MANFDDILFAGRPQAYGAYALRQAYRPTLGRAVLLGSVLFLGTLQLPRLYALVKPDKTQFMDEVILEHVTLDTPPADPVVIPPQTQPAPTVATVRNLVPDVVAEAPDDVPDVATVDELKEATSGQTTQEGTGEVEFIAPPEASKGPTVIEHALEVTPPEKEAVFVSVEQEPQFPGGRAALTDFLQKQLRYPAEASRVNAQGKVFIGFTVNTDGSIVDAAVLKGLGFGTDEEALRVLRSMPRWKPGRQAGRAVRVRYVLPITFALE
ncbi:TonB family protein [Fibrella sp. WM1]|uniref:energy transducer TonB n=1 Tax=Fibrella musci TaxID=3242485 RepID=UPI00351FA880